MCDPCDEYAELWEERHQRARVPHRCSACRETIRPGDRYRRIESLFDGDWSTVKQCARCMAVYDALAAEFGTSEIDPKLNCGEVAPEGSPLHEMAFVTPDEAQALTHPAPRATVRS